MVTCCFKVILGVSFALSIWDFATDIMAAYDFYQTTGDYQTRADAMIEDKSGEADSNFKADSEWFKTLKAEYDGLSEFDRDYVYCNAPEIQSKPDALVEEGTRIFYATCLFVGLSVIAIAVGYGALFCMCRSGEMDSDTEYTKLTDRERLWNFTSKTVIQFVEAGPQLAIVWLMIRRMGQRNGYICQEKFYECGVSGDCTMANLVVPVPLNSSLLDIAASDTILALSFVAGIIDVIFNFIAGSVLFLQHGVLKLLVLPFMQFSMALLPVMWVVSIDGIIPTGRTSESEGMLFLLITGLVSLCCLGSAVSLMCFGSKGPIGKDEDAGL